MKIKSKPASASLMIKFEDGSCKSIDLKNAICLGHSGLQAIEFRETKGGQWIMAYTESTFDGKKVETIQFEKNENKNR